MVDFTHTSISLNISLTYFITESFEGKNSSSTESWKQDLMQKPWRGAAY